MATSNTHWIDTRSRLSAAICLGVVVGIACLVPTMTNLSWLNIALAALLGICAAIGVFFWRPLVHSSGLIAVSASIAALLVSMSIPLARDQYTDLSITATGSKNPISKSSEVWVSLLPRQAGGNFDGAGWEKRGDGFVSYQVQPAVLQYRGNWSSGSVLRLIRHPYSGIAEVSIGGKTQKLDLFSETETSINIPLPEGRVTWKGYLQRAAIAIGLGVFFVSLGMGLAVASTSWGRVFMLALLAGCGTLWLVHDRSYAGSMEVVAFNMNSPPVRVEMDAGHGFTPALMVPVKSGTSVETNFAVQNPIDWRLNVEGGSLRALRDLDTGAVNEAFGVITDNDCPLSTRGRCVYELEGPGPLRVWLKANGEQKVVTLPEETPESRRIFLLVEREPGGIAVSASRAFVQLSPWEHFSQWVVALRLVDQDGIAAGKLVRLVSDLGGGYKFSQAVGIKGAYSVPTMLRPDTSSFVGMKIFAALISFSFVLLLAFAGKIAMALARSYRKGLRLQVVGTIFGCLGWLGLALLAGWPGVIGWDGFSPYIQAQTGEVTLWYGIGYPMIIGGFLLIGSGWLITIWSLLGTACLLLGAAALLLRHSSILATWLAPVLMCVVLPFTAIMVGSLTHLRDAMNGLMLAMFAFCGLYATLKWNKWAIVQRIFIFAAMLLGGAVLTLMRYDNIPTLLVVVAGLAVVSGGFRIGSLSIVAIAAVCWFGVGTQMERYIVPNGHDERNLYQVTAFVNPLVGMLVHGKDRIPDDLYVEISGSLNKVMDVEYAVQNWTTYDIGYWHQTHNKRDIPSDGTIKQLRSLYIRSLCTAPVLFIKLRLATFGAMLGYEWFELGSFKITSGNWPTFVDHLLTEDPNWRHRVELLGYSPKAHFHANFTRALLDWGTKVTSTGLQFIVCIVIALRFRRHPLAAVVAVGEVVRAGIFFLLAPAAVFLYLYDLHLLGFLLPMMALTEQAIRSKNVTAK